MTALNVLIYPDDLDKFSINFAGRNSKVPRYFESLFFAIDHILHVEHKEIISPMICGSGK